MLFRSDYVVVLGARVRESGPSRLLNERIDKAAEYLRANENTVAILCGGQAGGRSAVTPEMAALNLQYASIADNAGQLPQDVPVIAGAPAAYFATLPVRSMASAIRDAGLPGAVSYSAGTFVCNDLLFRLLHRFHKTTTGVGFVHVPYLPEQAKSGAPSMELGEILRALEAAIGVL